MQMKKITLTFYIMALIIQVKMQKTHIKTQIQKRKIIHNDQ